ncbi:MAG: hypothetical protein LQ340_001521 [Diploschistes diacapsis]|nr:MAG: hypothetical protein LQ340_001521 [Diploschistes diacapsis]
MSVSNLSTVVVSAKEKSYLEWFKCRTAVKLPGIFVSTFWDTLVFQATVDEPAVLHAVLALSAVHKNEILHGNRVRGQESLLDAQEKFMLYHYSKAINCLQPHFSAKNSASVRVALVTCVVFVCLELLRGHYQTAQAHLRNGVEILREIRACPNSGDNQLLALQFSHAPVDDWIADALSSLFTGVALFNPADQNTYLCLHAVEPELLGTKFESINQAKQHLDHLLNEGFVLSNQYRKQGNMQSSSNLMSRQRHIRAKLSSWLLVHNASKASLLAQLPVQMGFAHQLLRNYHTMASIMVDTSPTPTCEARFDPHAEDFVSIIDRSIGLWKIIYNSKVTQTIYGHPPEEANGIIEMGWIPPLYYVALKCRVHRVRLHAIRLLEASPHREGIWVATIVAAVARKVMQMEEGHFYEGLSLEDDFPICSSPKESHLLLPALPEQRRIQEVQLVLPDDPVGKVLLRYRQRNEAGLWEVYEREYDVRCRCWR